MASRFVEAHQEFIEETQVRTKTQKNVRTTGLKFSNDGQRQEEKNEQLESYEVQEINEALENFALYVISFSVGTDHLHIHEVFLKKWLSWVHMYIKEAEVLA